MNSKTKIHRTSHERNYLYCYFCHFRYSHPLPFILYVLRRPAFLCIRQKIMLPAFIPLLLHSEMKIWNWKFLISDTSINSIRISNLSETVTAMYPLLQPSLENLADQICKSQSLDHLTLSSDSPYTSQLLLNTIRDALKKAAATN